MRRFGDRMVPLLLEGAVRGATAPLPPVTGRGRGAASPGGRWACLAASLGVAAWLLGAVAVDALPEDPRSRVVLRSDCRTETARRDLTLFANGTLRVFEGLGATREMRLAELARAEMEAYLARLRKISFDDLAPQAPGLEGEWVERCRLELRLPGDAPRELEYGPYDSIPLGWKHALLVVDDLLEELRRAGSRGDRVRSYEPEVGDILVRRSDGARYEVIGFTLEGNGIELLGIEEPLTVYILRDHLLDEFDPPADDEP